MRNLKIVLEYDGSRYDGWQKGAGSRKEASVQEKIEEVLTKMEDTKAEVIGAIRTEAGVHAYHQIANFHTQSEKKAFEIKQYLNRYLPRDIAALEVSETDERFHAAFSAKSYTFEYRITLGDVPSVFDRKYNYYCFKRPDADKMREAAKKLLGTHDFAAYSENKRMKKSTLRRIDEITIYQAEQEMTIRIKGDDFWPNMVRIIVGTLLEIGLGKLDISCIDKAFESKNRDLLGATAEAKGLFLADICYE